jgi:hypothetical protein
VNFAVYAETEPHAWRFYLFDAAPGRGQTARVALPADRRLARVCAGVGLRDAVVYDGRMASHQSRGCASTVNCSLTVCAIAPDLAQLSAGR